MNKQAQIIAPGKKIIANIQDHQSTITDSINNMKNRRHRQQQPTRIRRLFRKKVRNVSESFSLGSEKKAFFA
jgi:hypothetical protein